MAFALIEKKLDLHICNENGQTVLLQAACRGYKKIVEVYRVRTINPDKFEIEGLRKYANRISLQHYNFKTRA
jgi:hypothetical protein